uniref:Uncharacterized protein n=1 Tax=Globisporangium ultimum (strain ATCC 200006 / CBS 805.95 / DAOM BR144) TaxID=431595 RepID=K3XAY9_GLOUD
MELRLRKVMEKRKKTKRKSVYRLSDLDAEKGERILKKMRLECDYLYFKEPVGTSVSGYARLDGAEDAATQRSSYLTYLETHLKSITEEKELHVLDVVEDETLLSVIDPRLPFQMDGTADVVLGDRRSVTYHELLLVALEYPSNAFQFIAAAVADSDSAKPFSVPFIDQTLTKCKIDDFLPMPADEMVERYELMANALESELLITRRVEYMQHLIRKMPMHAHMYEDDEKTL